MILACIGCCGIITRCREEARALTQVVREGHNHGDHRAPRANHCAAVDGCGVGPPTYVDHGKTYGVGAASSGASTADAATRFLLPPGVLWKDALTASDIGSTWPGYRGLLGGRDRMDCSPVCLAQTRWRGGVAKAT